MSSNVHAVNIKINNEELSSFNITSLNSFKNIPNIDELSIDDDGENFCDDIVDVNEEFDEKDEYISSQRIEEATMRSATENMNISEDLDKQAHEDYSQSGKSIFYVPDDTTDSTSYKSVFSQFYTNEKVIFTLKNVTCLYSSSIMRSKLMKNTSADTIRVRGELILTNCQRIFLPNKHRSINFCELDENYLSLFNNDNLGSFVIPLSFIYELKTCKFSNKLSN